MDEAIAVVYGACCSSLWGGGHDDGKKLSCKWALLGYLIRTARHGLAFEHVDIEPLGLSVPTYFANRVGICIQIPSLITTARHHEGRTKAILYDP